MKEFKTKPVPENTFTLSDGEIAVIHALCYYEPDGMTDAAGKVASQLTEQFNMHDAVGKFKVWKCSCKITTMEF